MPEAHMLTLTVKDVQFVVKAIKVLLQSKRSLLELDLVEAMYLDAEEIRTEIEYLEALLSYLLSHLEAVRKCD